MTKAARMANYAFLFCLLGIAVGMAGIWTESGTGFVRSVGLPLMLPAPAQAAEPNQDLTAGVAAVKRGNYDGAIALFSHAIKSGTLAQAEFAEAYFKRGTVYSRYKRDFGRGIADLSRAIEIRPDFAKAYANRGSAHAYAGRIDYAIADWEKTLAIEPDHALARRNLDKAYKSVGRRPASARARAAPTAPLPSTPQTREVQRALAALGYAPGPVDGVAGPRTRQAIRAFQADQGLLQDGRESSALREQLNAALKEPAVRIRKLTVTPSPARAGKAMDTRVEFMVSDPSSRDETLPVLVTLAVLRDSKALASFGPYQIEAKGGQRMTYTRHLKAGKEPGRYQLRATLEYKDTSKETTTELRVR